MDRVHFSALNIDNNKFKILVTKTSLYVNIWNEHFFFNLFRQITLLCSYVRNKLLLVKGQKSALRVRASNKRGFPQSITQGKQLP